MSLPGLLDALDQADVPGDFVTTVNARQALGITPFDAWLALRVIRRPEGTALRWNSEPLQALLSDHTQVRMQQALAPLEREPQLRLATRRR